MVLKIIWSPLALKSYSDNIGYLEKEWSEKEVNNFIASTEKKINFIKEFPEAGFISRKNKYLRKTLIGKRIILN